MGFLMFAAGRYFYTSASYPKLVGNFKKNKPDGVKGFENTNTAEIAQHAGVATGTLYSYEMFLMKNSS